MDENFLLETEAAQRLYHDHAAKMPICDFHCHLPAQEIAEDKQYDNLGEIWLGGDHYKWRAMRSNGIDETFVTGDASWREKFQKWAETMPYLYRNPLYHWAHLELQRYFEIDTVLSPETADEIYDACTKKLRTPEFSARNLMRMMNVKLVCTTDDPVDDLRWHKQLKEEGFEIKVLPTFRPDKAMNLSDTSVWNQYIQTLEAAAQTTISSAEELLEAIESRHAFFHQVGCRLSDHGVGYVPDATFSLDEIESIFSQARDEKEIEKGAGEKFQAWFLYEVGKMNHKRGWVQQFHVGAFRNNSTRMFKKIGADTGFDSIADYQQGPGLVRLLDRLDTSGELAKTILYNLNSTDNALMATLIGNYQDGSVPGKIQWGSAWWFLDQKRGMEEQLDTLSALGLLSRFVGMLTDSRSFLSYPRHEYFRRILCNLIGTDVENGEIPADWNQLGKMVEDISYRNTTTYFNFD